PGVLYQDVIPPPLRRLAQLVEVTVHLRYRSEQYAAASYVVFDRWIETATVYCGDYGRHRDWLERLEAGLPRPCPTFFVRVPPELAYERLVARGDRWTTIFSPAALLDKLRRLADRYELVMADVEHVPLDGTRPAPEVLAEAVRQVRHASSAS
nr:hypothetical protein [Micromonospora sp. DSM 115978]